MQPCSAETRFQGIATSASAKIFLPCSVERLAVPRPVFRGLRPAMGTDGHRPIPLGDPCSAETRFQGIATSQIDLFLVLEHVPLAVPRPVFRGLRQAWNRSSTILQRFSILQCRDPFSGDCDASLLVANNRANSFLLAVPRPVFRGLRLTIRVGGYRLVDQLLAVPRPVFRGLRRRTSTIRRLASSRLAVPRPVFRGLRRRPLLVELEDAPRPACSAETRFQGIATLLSKTRTDAGTRVLAVPRPVFRELRRCMGLAFPSQLRRVLAVPRPVFRGL